MKIEVIISPRGESRIETSGFAGAACREASRSLEAALGKTTSERLTAEFHSAPAQQPNELEKEN